MSEQEKTPGTHADHVPTAFESQVVRRTWHECEWWFAIVDVIGALTDSVQPEGYLKDLRKRDKGLAEGWGQIASPLRLTTPGGVQLLNCANMEGVLRIIQSIPSPKAEPFKRWLAKVGYERIQPVDSANSFLQRQLAQEAGSGQPYEKIVRLKMQAPDGKRRTTDCATTATRDVLSRVLAHRIEAA